MTDETKPEQLLSVLIVDDDQMFRHMLARALERRGFAVTLAGDVASALRVIQGNPPEYAVLDLNMPGESGLTLIPQLKALDEQTRIVVLTGYSSIATAVEAIKLGATHYLAKPANADDILAAFGRETGDTCVPINDRPPTINRLEWEHIQKVLQEYNGNISATARALSMHRRTLQRKLGKRPAKD